MVWKNALKKATTGVIRAGGDVVENIGDGTSAIQAIVGDVAKGDKPKFDDVKKLAEAGISIAAIANIYGVGAYVIEEMLQGDDPTTLDKGD